MTEEFKTALYNEINDIIIKSGPMLMPDAKEYLETYHSDLIECIEYKEYWDGSVGILIKPNTVLEIKCCYYKIRNYGEQRT